MLSSRERRFSFQRRSSCEWGALRVIVTDKECSLICSHVCVCMLLECSNTMAIWSVKKGSELWVLLKQKDKRARGGGEEGRKASTVEDIGEGAIRRINDTKEQKGRNWCFFCTLVQRVCFLSICNKAQSTGLLLKWGYRKQMSNKGFTPWKQSEIHQCK